MAISHPFALAELADNSSHFEIQTQSFQVYWLLAVTIDSQKQTSGSLAC